MTPPTPPSAEELLQRSTRRMDVAADSVAQELLAEASHALATQAIMLFAASGIVAAIDRLTAAVRELPRGTCGKPYQSAHSGQTYHCHSPRGHEGECG